MNASILIEPIESQFGNSQIARGAFGTIALAIHKSKDTYKYVALKSIRNALCPNRESLTIPVFTELASLRALSQGGGHENVIKLLSVEANEGSEVTLVFPYCHIDLHEILQSQRFRHCRDSSSIFGDSTIRSIMGDILYGLQYCHSKGVIHCDMKPGNVLFNMSLCKFQLADFGLAQLVTHSVPAVGLCTLPYRPPELLFGCQHYESSIDIWGAGLILAEILNSGRPLFYGMSVLDQLGKMMDVLGTPNSDSWPGIDELPDYGKVSFDKREGVGLRMVLKRVVIDQVLEKFVGSMVALDPSKRASAKECLADEWMQGEFCSNEYLRKILVPDDYTSSYHDIEVGNKNDEQKSLLLEQMKLKGAAIALEKRKTSSRYPGPTFQDEKNEDDGSDYHMKASMELATLFSSEIAKK